MGNVIIDDLSTIGELTTVEQNSYVAIGAFIGSNVSIGKWVRIGARTYISSHSVINDYCEIGANVKFSEELAKSYYEANDIISTIVEDNCKIGDNTLILRGVKIGRKVVVLEGSRVIFDLDANKIYKGDPATEFYDLS